MKNAHQSSTERLQVAEYLPEQIRHHIEQTYYAKVNEQATLEQLIHNPHFLANPTRHVAMFSDHGVVHARDIAQQILSVLTKINGMLIPEREDDRLAFMRGYGVIVAYLHDIGMCDFSAFGRAMHPEFAAQAVFQPEFDEIVDILWERNCGNLAWRLLNLSCQQVLCRQPKLMLREMLALSMCHSKSKVPIEALNDPHRLQQLMQRTISTDLHDLYRQQRASSCDSSLDKEARSHKQQPVLDRFYTNVERESFAWLCSPEPALRDVVYDVVDTLRALRTADALRQRGTTLKTSGAYEIFVDQTSAKAIYALRSHGNRNLFFIEADDPVSAGEANLAGSEFDYECNLRIACHRGAFSTPERVQWAAQCVAHIIHDIQADVIGSFYADQTCYSPTLPAPRKTWRDIGILVEGVDDNSQFASHICQELRALDADVGSRSRPVPSFQNVDPAELALYLRGEHFNWSQEQRATLLKYIFGDADEASQHMDLTEAFKDARIICLDAGEQLVDAGGHSGFVYIPLNEGLRVFPLGGYTSVYSPAYIPIGNTGVIRGATRNARIIAEMSVDVLIIPKQVYLDYWYRTYHPADIRRLFRDENPYLIWKEAYSVRIPHIDAQHIKLFALSRQLAETMQASEVGTGLQEILSELTASIHTHFCDEEQLMQAHHYSGYEEHKQAHQVLEKQVNEFALQCRQEKKMLVQTGKFLRNWLIDHIQDMDKRYSVFLQSNNLL